MCMYRRMQHVRNLYIYLSLGSVSIGLPTLLVIHAKLTSNAASLCYLLPSTGPPMHLTMACPSGFTSSHHSAG